jgi:hypothetical protein
MDLSSGTSGGVLLLRLYIAQKGTTDDSGDNPFLFICPALSSALTESEGGKYNGHLSE